MDPWTRTLGLLEAKQAGNTALEVEGFAVEAAIDAHELATILTELRDARAGAAGRERHRGRA